MTTRRPGAAGPVTAPSGSTSVGSLTFLDGGDGWAGSKVLVRSGQARLLVNCGLRSGTARVVRGESHPPIALSGIDCVVLTDASADRGGGLPVLAAGGGRGPVYVTPPASTLLSAALAGSACSRAEDAAEADAAGWPDGILAEPVNLPSGCRTVTSMVRELEPGVPAMVAPGMELTFGHAGHLLGGAWVRLRIGSTVVVVTGVLGGSAHPFLYPPRPCPPCDVLVLASSGVTRSTPGLDIGRLAAAVNRTAGRGGSVLVPADPVGYTEVILSILRGLIDAGEIPVLPILLDRPDGSVPIGLHQEALRGHRPDVVAEGAAGLDLATWPGELRIRAEAGSKDHYQDPSVVIAGASTANSGRVRHHLGALLPEREHTVVLPAPAAPGSGADRLAAGDRHVKVSGHYVRVRSGVVELTGLGALADHAELVAWATTPHLPGITYVLPGRGNDDLRQLLRTRAGCHAVTPADGEEVLL